MTDAITPTLAAIKTMVATSAKFQEITGAANTAAAEAFVHEFAAEPSAALPRAIIDFENIDEGWDTGGFTYNGEIQILLMYQIPIPDAYQTTHPTQAAWFWAVIGAIRSEMEDAIRSLGITARRRSMPIPPFPMEQEDIPPGYDSDNVWLCQMEVVLGA